MGRSLGATVGGAKAVSRLAVVTLCIGLSAYLLPSAYAASAAEELKRAASHIVAAEQGLAEAKASALATFRTLQSGAIEADDESAKWAHQANSEGDAQMKAIMYRFRDAFASHSQQLTAIGQPLRDLADTGEKLELLVKLLHVLQSDLAQAVQGEVAPGKTRSALAGTKQGLDLLLQDLAVSAERLRISRDQLGGHAAALLQFDKKVRQLLTFLGDPQDRIRKWEKQVVQTELDNNTRAARELANVVALEERNENALAALVNATKTLQLVASGL